MSKFQVGQLWVTRDGSKARIVATDCKDDYRPLIALVLDAGGKETAEQYDCAGRWDGEVYEHSLDLIREHREPREVWVGFDNEGGLKIVGLNKRPGRIKFREVIE